MRFIGCSEPCQTVRSSLPSKLIPVAALQPHAKPDDRESGYRAYQRFVFAVAAIELPRECFGELGRLRLHVARAKEIWQEQRDLRGVFVEYRAEAGAQVFFFVAHHGVIKHYEINHDQAARPPGMAGDGESRGEKRAAEVERIARAGVWARGGEFAIFAQVTCGNCADEDAESGDGCAHGNP